MASLWNTAQRGKPSPLALTALNHISRNCASVEESVQFYSKVLGFVQVKRPGAFDFEGAWLFNYGIGIHLLKDDKLDAEERQQKEIDPKADHISFQCEDMLVVENGLRELKIKFKRQTVEEGGVLIDQLFFHDPDNHMVEICNCQLLPVVPLSACPPCRLITLQPPNTGDSGKGDFRGLQKNSSAVNSGGSGRVTEIINFVGYQRDFSGVEIVGDSSMIVDPSFSEGDGNQRKVLLAEKLGRDAFAPCA